MIYVEIKIKGALDDVWRLTQTPQLHERWDLRFNSIEYLLRPDESKPQTFKYSTKIGFGLTIEGWGETAGKCLADDSRTSALKFGSDDPKSLIKAGSGYWKYVPKGETLQFFTGYDYKVRGGILGRFFDNVIFRPMIGWATAWSFDRLRIWIEDGVAPEQALRTAFIHAICTAIVAFVWLWQGLVPKLLFHQPLEWQMLVNAGVNPVVAKTSIAPIGVGEIIFGILVIVFNRQRWPWILSIIALSSLIVGVVLCSPLLATATFNPVTLNFSVIALAAIGYLSVHGSPTAKNCLRKQAITESNKEI